VIFLKKERRFFDSQLFNPKEGGHSNELQSGSKETLGISGWGIEAPRAGENQRAPGKLPGVS
jgi:hypothetical protein